MPSQAISTSPVAAGSAAPLRIDETRGDASAALLDAGAAMAGDEILRPDPLAHRAEQHALQIGAQQRDMRPLMAGRLAERLAIDELAVAREEGVVLRLAGGRDQRVLEPERAQLLHRVRADMDADAERPHLGGGLEHADAARRPRGVQRQRQRRAADPAADDDRVHAAIVSMPHTQAAGPDKPGHRRASKAWAGRPAAYAGFGDMVRWPCRDFRPTGPARDISEGADIGVRSSGGCPMAKPHETLEKVGLLRSLERKDREIFEHRCQWRHAHPKEWLLEQNDIGTDIYFLTSGVVRVLITPSPDREVILGDIEAGGYFGEMAAIDGQPRSAGILAITDATIARMPATVFREIIHKYPDVSEQLLAAARRPHPHARSAGQRIQLDARQEPDLRRAAAALAARSDRSAARDRLAAAGAFRHRGAGQHAAGDGGARAESAGARGLDDQAPGRFRAQQRPRAHAHASKDD